MLTSKGKYGLKALVHLAEHEGQGSSLIAEIAANNNIPKKFLDAILLDLKNAGYLSSKKGRGGGYSLARPASRIIIGDIIRVLDGPLAPIPCASRTAYRRCDDCRDEASCELRIAFAKAYTDYLATLEHLTLADVMSQADRERLSPGLTMTA